MNQEKIKEFVKLNKNKVFVFISFIIINFIFSSYFWEYLGFRKLGGVDDNIGIPFIFYSYKTSAPLPDTNWVIEKFSLSYLFFDIILWYLISCVIIYFGKKAKKP